MIFYKNYRDTIQAFYQALENILLNCQDVTVMQAKLNWWRQDILKIETGRPEHPIVLRLQKYRKKISLKKMIDLIDGFEQVGLSLPFASFEDAVIHIMRTAGGEGNVNGRGFT